MSNSAMRSVRPRGTTALCGRPILLFVTAIRRTDIYSLGILFHEMVAGRVRREIHPDPISRAYDAPNGNRPTS